MEKCREFICIYTIQRRCYKTAKKTTEYVEPKKLPRCIASRDISKCKHHSMCECCANIDCIKKQKVETDEIKEDTSIAAVYQDFDEEPIIIRPHIRRAEAYIDGSFNQNTSTYGYGGFLIDGDGNKHIIKGCNRDPELAKSRNISGEIMGAINVINKARKLEISELTINYDYMGIEMWATGKWSANTKGSIYYRDFVSSLHDIKLIFNHVKGHSNNKGNDEADLLAKQAVGLR